MSSIHFPLTISFKRFLLQKGWKPNEKGDLLTAPNQQCCMLFKQHDIQLQVGDTVETYRRPCTKKQAEEFLANYIEVL